MFGSNVHLRMAMKMRDSSYAGVWRCEEHKNEKSTVVERGGTKAAEDVDSNQHDLFANRKGAGED